MLITLPANGSYKINNDFPLLAIPTDMKGAESVTMNDFQWWSYSTDFKKWLVKNPSKWQAESNDTTKYELVDFLNENIEYDTIDYKKNTEVVESYDSYITNYNRLNEDKEESDIKLKEATKLHFAYHSLKKSGKLQKEFNVARESKGGDYAVFLKGKGDDGDTSMLAYRIKATPTPSDKIKFFDLTEILPGGPIGEKSLTQMLKIAMEYSGIILGTGLAAVGVFFAVKAVGSTYSAFRALTSLKYATTSKDVLKRARDIKKINNTTKIKSIWGGMRSMLMLKNTRAAIKGASVGFKYAKSTFKATKSTTLALKAFAKTSAAASAKAGSKLIPFVGEVLMVIDAVGSSYNWWFKEQAPMYTDVKSFAKNEFSPKEVKIGVPITISWSQEANSGLGMAINLIANNDTRTTMELIKIKQTSKNSIFILYKINAKSMQDEVAKHKVTLISFDNSVKINDQSGFWNATKRMFDNEDLRFKMLFIDNDITSVLEYMGHCNWSDLVSAYDKASTQLLVADPDTPDTYNLYFSDTEENVTNVKGRKVTTEELAKFTEADYQRIFSYGLSGEKKSKNESVYIDLLKDARLVNFSDYENLITEEYKSEDKPKENTDTTASADTSELTSDQKSGPGKLTIYIVTNKTYANPELKNREVAEFTNFFIPNEYLTVPDHDPIQVGINTDEMLDNTRKGIYVYKKKSDKDSASGDAGKDTEENTKDNKEEDFKDTKDDYYVSTNPDDVTIKNRRNRTTITDNSVKDGINILDEFLTDRDKETLGISTWKSLTQAKEIYNKAGDVIKVKLINTNTTTGERRKIYREMDGEAFQIAKKFVEETKDRIKYD